MQCLCHLTSSLHLTPIQHAVVDADLLPILIEVLSPPLPGATCFAREVLLNLAKTNCKDLHAKLLQSDVLPALVKVLQSDESAYKTKDGHDTSSEDSTRDAYNKAVTAACTTLTQMMAAPDSQRSSEAMVDAGVLPALLDLISLASPFDMKHAATAMCAIIAQSSRAQASVMKQRRALAAIV